MGLLGAAVVTFFWPAAVLEGAFFVQDVMVQNHPFRDFFARALREGQLPLWNAAINCGFPLFAEGQAGPLYPPNVILALLLPTWATLSTGTLSCTCGWRARVCTRWCALLVRCGRPRCAPGFAMP